MSLGLAPYLINSLTKFISLENAKKNVEDIVGLGIARIDILPFHQLGANKYGALGLKYECEDLQQLSEKEIAAPDSATSTTFIKLFSFIYHLYHTK